MPGWLLPVVLPSVVVAVVVAIRHPVTWYTADSVAQQSILRTWFDVGHDVTYLPPDTWIAKFPVYLLPEALPLDPSTRLLIEALALNVLTFALLGGAVWSLGNRWQERPTTGLLTLPLLWLAAIAGGVGSSRMLLNVRNIELGLAFVLLALVAGFLAGRRPRTAGGKVCLAVGATAALALFWLDDPYIAFLVGAPLAAACALWWVVRERDGGVLAVAAVLVVSLALIGPTRTVAGWFGIVVVAEPGLGVSLDGLGARVALLPEAIGVQSGMTSLDRDVHPLVQVLVLAVLLAGLVASAAVAWTGWRQRNLVACFIGLHLPVVLAGFLASAHTSDIRSGRYLVLGAYDLVVALALAGPTLSRRAARWRSGPAGNVATVLVASLVVVGALANLTTLIPLRTGSAPQQADLARQDRLLDAVASLGVQKGYAQFWDANTTAYLGEGPPLVSAVRCRGGRLVPYDWLTDSARRSAPATSTFLVWEPDGPDLLRCSAAVVTSQLGSPARVVPVDPARELWVYDRDITADLTG